MILKDIPLGIGHSMQASLVLQQLPSAAVRCLVVGA